jgi:hypothetical protein
MRKEYVVLKCCHIDATVCGYAEADTAQYKIFTFPDITE